MLAAGPATEYSAKVMFFQAGGTDGESHGGSVVDNCRVVLAKTTGAGDHGRRIGNSALVGGEVHGDTGDAVLVCVLDLGDDGLGKD